MLAKSFPKVSLESRLSRESYNAKFGMDDCARKNYRVTLIGPNVDSISLNFTQTWNIKRLFNILYNRTQYRYSNFILVFKLSFRRKNRNSKCR